MDRDINETCISATGCSAAELLAFADSLPVNTLAAAVGATQEEAGHPDFLDSAKATLEAAANDGE